MTPEEARQLLEGTSPGPWEAESLTYDEPAYPEPIVELQVTAHNGNQVAARSDFDSDAYEPSLDFDLIAAAPGMAAMIAGMRTEYAVQIPNGELVGVSWSSYGSYETAREHRDAWRRDGYDANIVRRFVTAPQPLGEDQ